MVVQVIDTLGLKCHLPVLKIAATAPDLRPGDIMEVWGDCPTFEHNVRIWCERLSKTLLSVHEDGGDKKVIKIQL